MQENQGLYDGIKLCVSFLTLELLSLLGFSATELCTGIFINLLFITPGFCV